MALVVRPDRRMPACPVIGATTWGLAGEMKLDAVVLSANQPMVESSTCEQFDIRSRRLFTRNPPAHRKHEEPCIRTAVVQPAPLAVNPRKTYFGSTQ